MSNSITPLTVDARLANDTSTQRSLFTGKFNTVTSIKLELSSIAQGTANFAIFENGEQKVSQRVSAGQSISHAAPVGNELAFYVNYYDGEDLASAYATLS